MRAEPFRSFQDTQPFEPFAIHVADGRSFRISHPDAASVSADGRTVLVLNDEKLIEAVDMLLVVSLRPLKITTPKKKR